jgi:hypothetical protein
VGTSARAEARRGRGALNDEVFSGRWAESPR